MGTKPMPEKSHLKLVSIHIKKSPQAMGLAALLLKSYLELEQTKGDTVLKKLNTTCLDFYSNEPVEIILESLEKTKLDLVGFSTYIWNRQKVVWLATQLKNKYPDIIVFAGGAEASANPVSLLNDGPFDFVIKGEAELTLSEVMKELLADKSADRIGLENIPGVYTQKNIQDIQSIQDAPLVMNLDKLPSPFLQGSVDLKNRKGVLWELCRGCKFHCTYCYEGLGVKTVRNFSLERIKAELELFEANKIDQIFVLDPIFNRDPKRTKEILELITKIAPQIHFIFEIRTEYLQEDVVALFRNIHCSLQIGLESTNPEALKAVRRNFDSEKYALKIELLNVYNVSFGLDLIYGLPKDSLSGFKKSLDYAVRLQPNHLDIFVLSVLPGTELYEDQQKFELNVKADAPYSLISSPTFSEKEMKEAALLSEVVDLFYNRGTAVPWFFMVLETLQVEPSTFFDRFLNTTYKKQKKDISVSEILQHQIEFIQEQFQLSGYELWFSVLRDIIQYHHALNQSLMAGPISETTNNKSKILTLAPATKIVHLEYNLENLMSVGEYTFEEFLEIYKPEKTSLLVYNSGGEVICETIDFTWALFLEKFEQQNSIANVVKNEPFKEIASKEISEFVEFCLQQNILV
ncbi:MAG: radical SAM protein [Leptospirales bacterium]